MKRAQILLITILAGLFFSGFANAATVVTDAQIAEINTLAQAGGDVTQAAEDMMAGITADLIAQGLTGDELQAQVAVAVQEMTSGLDAGASNFEAIVSDIVQGGASGAALGVNQAVGADPNLDAGTLTASVSAGAAGAVAAIGAANPGLNTGNLQAAVNQGLQGQGAPPVEPEAFEPADPAPVVAGPVAPPAAPPEVVETPPTGDDVASN